MLNLLVLDSLMYTHFLIRLTVKVNNEVVSSNSVSINGNTTDSVSISASSGDMVELILSDIKAGGRIISGVRSSDKFIY